VGRDSVEPSLPVGVEVAIGTGIGIESSRDSIPIPIPTPTPNSSPPCGPIGPSPPFAPRR